MPSALAQEIFRTVCWFSIFDYPVTAMEIWKWLYSPGQKRSLGEVWIGLQDDPWLKDRLQTRDGFYLLKGGQPIAAAITERGDRFLDATRKYKKLRRLARRFGLVPGVRAVAAANTLAWWQTRAQSDIDLFIIARPGTLWLTRLLLVAPFVLGGGRPEKNGVRPDPLCFTFFVTTRAMNIMPLAIDGADPYLMYWTKALTPIVDRGRTWNAFEEANAWVNLYLPNAALRAPHRQLTARPWPALPGFFRVFEGWARRLQQRRFPEAIKKSMNRDNRVVVSDTVLKFHVDDPREQYLARWKQWADQAKGEL
jgi:hypothetical protein